MSTATISHSNPITLSVAVAARERRIEGLDQICLEGGHGPSLTQCAGAAARVPSAVTEGWQSG